MSAVLGRGGELPLVWLSRIFNREPVCVLYLYLCFSLYFIFVFVFFFVFSQMIGECGSWQGLSSGFQESSIESQFVSADDTRSTLRANLKDSFFQNKFVTSSFLLFLCRCFVSILGFVMELNDFLFQNKSYSL